MLTLNNAPTFRTGKLLRWLGLSLCALLLYSTQAQAIQSRTDLQNLNLDNTISDNLGANEFLPVDQAFQLSIDVYEDRLILLWQIAPGYYLYGHKLAFELTDATGQIVETVAEIPPGLDKYDDYFGDVVVYYDQLVVEIGLPGNADELRLRMQAQGCADAGLCYPVQKYDYSIDRKLLNASPYSAPAEKTFLPVDEAYKLSIRVLPDRLLLDWDIAPDYYLYQHMFRFSLSDEDGNDIPVEPILPAGVEQEDEYLGKTIAHYGPTHIELPFQSDAQQLRLKLRYQGCTKGLCYAVQKQQFSIDRITASATEIRKAGQADAAAQHEQVSLTRLLTILVLAALGGSVLNLMPCVFPVLSLKVFSLTHHQHNEHSRPVVHGLVYTCGVIVSFTLVAALMISLRASGEAIGWGFHLQSPWFVAALTYLFLLMALAMGGMLELGSGMMGIGQTLTQRSGYTGSFFTGVLAVVVASPCTAPFMGSALGFAMTQPTPTALAVFAALGLGMATPFLLLTASPILLNHLPKPGPWMDIFKRFMAFPLLATCIWLLWVLGNQAGSTGVAITLAGCLLIAFACWLQSIARRPSGLRTIISALLVLFSLYLLSSPFLRGASNTYWSAYSAAKLQQHRDNGEAVFVDATADWCITCLANEQLTLEKEEVKQAFADHGVVMMKADWTNEDPAITALLAEYGRNGVPLYLLFPADQQKPARVLPQILNSDIIFQALAEME